MSAIAFRNYAALFFASLGAFLVTLFIGNFIASSVKPTKVIESMGKSFKICEETKIVKPGEVVCYIIHYRKYVDIPGDITKQLIVTPRDGGMEVYIPLGDTAGHLPVGDIQKKAYAQLPLFTPEGTAMIKLSSSYHIGNKPFVDVIFTEKFEVRK